MNELIEAVDIVDFISQYVELEQRGDEFWGLSPFKNEKTPSFSVRGETGQFYDFSSGIGGNVFTFTRRFFNCNSERAVHILSEFTGLKEGDLPAIRSRLSATNVIKKFTPMEPKKKVQKNKSEFKDDHMERFERRTDKLKSWIDEGISLESITRFDVRYDGFSNRIVYPIKDLDGTIVNIGGRTLDSDWKEKGLRKYTYFAPWGSMNVVYGLFENMEFILEKKEVIVFEGCKSVLLADTWGIRNTAAILTSHLNQNQVKILAALGVRVVFGLDRDIDIRKDRNIRRLKRYVNVEYIEDIAGLTGDKDAPVDKGLGVFARLYKSKKIYR